MLKAEDIDTLQMAETVRDALPVPDAATYRALYEASRAVMLGNQWSMDDRALLEEQNRPCVTFNRIAPIALVERPRKRKPKPETAAK